ncbi:MAG: DUF106 domain-containing protein [Candidatus Aenigmarchaeota archaeon]|nr:DUF106 domain-containing protein [Candidatus Aenigmarchaeota archaeon]
MVFEALNPSVSVTIIAAVVLLIINVFYRFLINQEKASALKERVAFLSAEARKVSKDSPEKSKEFMKEMMTAQRDMMRMNMKPMIVSLVIVALVLPFLASEFNDVSVPLDATEIKLNGNVFSLGISDSTIRVGDSECNLPCSMTVGNKLWKFSEEKGQLKSYAIVATMPFSVPVVGSEWGWILWYILVSIPLAIIIRAAYGIKT